MPCSKPNPISIMRMPLAFHFNIRRQGHSQSLKANIGVVFFWLNFNPECDVSSFFSCFFVKMQIPLI